MTVEELAFYDSIIIERKRKPQPMTLTIERRGKDRWLIHTLDDIGESRGFITTEQVVKLMFRPQVEGEGLVSPPNNSHAGCPLRAVVSRRIRCLT